MSTSTNPIYHYRASEELNTDAWGTLVCRVVDETIREPQLVKALFAGWETEYKDETQLPIPGAWRSAKSVINGAIKHGIPMIDVGTGKPRGKTAVEQDIKAAKTSVAAPESPEEKLAKMIENARSFAAKNGLNFSDYL